MAGAKANLFAELNKGHEVTSGLQHIDRHELKKQQDSGAPPVVAPKPGSAAKPSAAGPKASDVIRVEPKLHDKKWIVEGAQNVQLADPIVVKPAELSQTVYIYKCTNVAVHVNGKLNGVVMDSCKRLTLKVDNVIGSVELVNCQRAHLFVTEKLVLISIDKSDDVQLHMSQAALDAVHGGKELKIVTSKHAGVNIVIPQPDGDEKELAVPSQFVSYLENGKVITVPAESVGC